MKGWASEILIACGVYFVSQNHVLGYILLSMGILAAIVRFGASLIRTKIKDDILLSMHSVLKGAAIAVGELDSEKLRTAVKETTIH